MENNKNIKEKKLCIFQNRTFSVYLIFFVLFLNEDTLGKIT